MTFRTALFIKAKTGNNANIHQQGVVQPHSGVCACMPSRAGLCGPMDCIPPGSSVHGILQARILEWVAMPSSRGSFRPQDQTHVSCVFCIAGGFFKAELQGAGWGWQSTTPLNQFNSQEKKSA